jgi:hypothetical protein
MQSNDSDHKLQGNFSIDNISIEFEAERQPRELVNSLQAKIKNFSIILSLIGSFHLFHSMFIVKKLEMDPNYAKKVRKSNNIVITNCFLRGCVME